MKTTLNTLAGAICGMGLLASSAFAQDAEHKLSEFQLGETIAGEEVKLDELEGKVVVIEYWGTR